MLGFLFSKKVIFTECSYVNDYCAFGSLIPNRHGSSAAYRYGFQGQEKDDELKGEGNSLNYTFRMHDPRVGRFFAVDPLTSKYPHYSPYQFAGNKVIQYVELEGLEEGFVMTIDRAPKAIKDTQEALKVTSATVVKLGYKHYLPVKFIDHYTESKGETLFLTNKETEDCHMKVVSLINGSNKDEEVVKKEKAKFNSELNSLKPGGSKNVLLNVSGRAGTHGTLGHCTVIFKGILTKEKDGENWNFNGVMQFYDYWNFDEKKVGGRTTQGEAATAIGRTMLIGKGFKIYSPIYKVTESSKDGQADWFKDKDCSDLNTKNLAGQTAVDIATEVTKTSNKE